MLLAEVCVFIFTNPSMLHVFFLPFLHDTRRMGVTSCVSYTLSGLALVLAAGAVELVRNAAWQTGG